MGMAKVSKKSEKITPFGGIFQVREEFSRFVGPVIFSNLESEGIHIRRARMDCGSCSRQIVETVEKHSEHFYIRANNCSSLYDSLLALRGWQHQEINGIEYELNSIITEKCPNLGAYCFFDNKPEAIQGYCIEGTNQRLSRKSAGF